MSERQYGVPMMESDMQWVRGYLSQDAATNHPRLQEATHWWVWEWMDSNGIRHVEVCIGDSEDKFEESGFSTEEMYHAMVGRLQTEGFPIHEYC